MHEVDEVKESTKGKKWNSALTFQLAMTTDLQTAQFLFQFDGYKDMLHLVCFKDDNEHLPEGLWRESLVQFQLSIICLAFFDECHQDCVKKFNPNGQLLDVQYPRDENWDYEPYGQYLPSEVHPKSLIVLRCVSKDHQWRRGWSSNACV